MVAAATASAGLALANDRRLTPVFVEAAPQPQTVVMPPAGSIADLLTAGRDFIARRLLLATLIGLAFILIAASLPAVSAFASSLRSPATVAPTFGPPNELRAGAGVSGNWEQSYSLAAPPADQMGAALMAGAAETQGQDLMSALVAIAEQRAATQGQVRAAAAPSSPNAASGLEPGTVMRARVTIYGCTGPGGGFCNHMASGAAVFEGAAACSSNLPFGTKLTIAGDPTGRVYECLDRGSLSATWIDVYFENTTDGMAWQSELGATSADITIVN